MKKKEIDVEQLVYSQIGVLFLALISGDMSPEVIVLKAIDIQVQVSKLMNTQQITFMQWHEMFGDLESLIDFCGGTHICTI